MSNVLPFERPATPHKSKRGNGSVFFDTGRQQWSALSPRSAEGKRQVIGRFDNELDAQIALRQWHRETPQREEARRKANREDLTVRQAVERWATRQRALGNIRESTWSSTHEPNLRNHIFPAIGDRLLRELTADDVHAILQNARRRQHTGHHDGRPAEITRQRLSAGTRQKLWNLVSAACAFAERNDLVSKNPLANSERPCLNGPQKKLVAWTDEEVTRFIAGTRGHTFRLLWWSALAVGGRINEMLGLQWEDVDLEKATVDVHCQLLPDRTRGPLKNDRKGTGKGKRIVSIAHEPDLLAALKTAKESARAPWVFPSQTGGPLLAHNVADDLEGVVERLGLPRLTLHGLRHTSATLLLLRGVSLSVVAYRLGDSMETVEKHYRRFVPGHDVAVIATLAPIKRD
jgi:integrase